MEETRVEELIRRIDALNGSNLIDRQKLIDVFTGLVLYADLDGETKSYMDGLMKAYNIICQAPSVQPEHQKGRWIGKCDADMRGEQNEQGYHIQAGGD